MKMKFSLNDFFKTTQRSLKYNSCQLVNVLARTHPLKSIACLFVAY